MRQYTRTVMQNECWQACRVTVSSPSDRLGWRVATRLIGSFVVVVVSEASQPLFRAGLTAPPEGVKAVDSHGHSLEPLFDVVPVFVVEVTAQIVA
jgi:hypothetical protein